MIRGRFIYFLVLLMSGTAYSQGFAPQQQWYSNPQNGQGYGMYGAQQACGSAPRRIPEGIKVLERTGSQLEKELTKKERALAKASDQLIVLQDKLWAAEGKLDSAGGETYKQSIKVFRRTYAKDGGGCSTADGQITVPKGVNSTTYLNAYTECTSGNCGACRPTQVAPECKTEADCTKSGCNCEYDEVFACNVSKGSSGCSGNLKKVRELEAQIAAKEAEIARLEEEKARVEGRLQETRDRYDSRMSDLEYGDSYGSEAGTCFSCMESANGRGYSNGANGFSLAQTGIAAGIQVLGMTLDWKNRGRMMDVYGDLGWPPPPNAFAPFVVGGYGYPFMQGGFYGGVGGGFGGGGFGCGGSVGGGGYPMGPYGMQSPWGMGPNPYGYPPGGMWGNPYMQGGMGPYGPYMPGMFPGGGMAGPGMGAGFGMQAGFGMGMGMPGMGMGMPGMPGYGMGMPGYGMGMPGMGMGAGFGMGAGMGMGMPGYGMPGMGMPGMPGYGMPGYGMGAGMGMGMPGYGMPGMGMPGMGMPGYGMPGMGMPGMGMPGYGMPGMGMPGMGMPGYGMPGMGMPGMPGYGMPGMPGYGMPGMPGMGPGGMDYTTYMRQMNARYMDNYTSTLREYQNLSFDMNSMYQRLQMLQMQLSNPYSNMFGATPVGGVPAPVPTPTPGSTPGR